MDHRSPPPQPPRELQLPSSAVAPVRRRTRSQRSPRQATIPAVPAPAALPVRRPSARRQIPAPTAAAGADDDDAEVTHNLMILAHIIVAHADAEAAEAAAPPAAAAAAAGKNLRLSPPLSPAAAAADDDAAEEVEEKPDDAPEPLPFPPVAAEHQNPSALSMDHGDAGTKASADDCKKVSCFSSQGNVGSSKCDQHGGGVVSPLPAAGAPSPMQLGDDDEEELEPGEIPPEKPAAGCNVDRARGSILGKYKPITGELAAAGSSSAHRAALAHDMSAAAEEKRKREVFVGGLSRDAVEDDVRAALSAAGEITQVRMIMDWTTNKNKGYCFVAYREAAMASRAIAELSNVKICGAPCRVAVPEGNQKTRIAQRDPTIEYYNRIYEQRQPSPTLAAQSSYITSWDHHASYVVPPAAATQAGYYYPMYHNGNIVYLPPPDLNHGRTAPSERSQMGQSAGSSRLAGQPHRSRN